MQQQIAGLIGSRPVVLCQVVYSENVCKARLLDQRGIPSSALPKSCIRKTLDFGTAYSYIYCMYIQYSGRALRVALYARVSTKKDQTVENQLLALREWAAGRGHEMTAEFVDEGISGAKGRDKRPGLDALIKAATLAKFDMVGVTALDRLGRSLPHLVGLVAELEALKVGLFVRNLALDTSTPAGQLMFNVMGSLAQFERELIRERTMLGLERARKQGKTLGRPKVSAGTEHRIADMLRARVPVNKIMRLARVGASTVYRIKKESEACPTST